MRRHRLFSSAIRQIGYDPRTRQLEVDFTSGERYRFFSVPRKDVSPLRSPLVSAGGHFNAHIRNRYNFERVSP